MTNEQKLTELLIKIAEAGRQNPSPPQIANLFPFRHYFDGNSTLLRDKLSENDGLWTRREIVARFLFLQAVLDQGAHIEGVRQFLAEVTNNLYEQEIRFLHKPIDFFREIGIAVDTLLSQHESVKNAFASIWAKENQSKESFDKFWDEYSAAEIKIYSDILANRRENISGSFGELVEKYDVGETLFMGFLDGVNSSLIEPLDLESMETGASITLAVDFEKLYFNMLAANADHLYTLHEWETVLESDKREEITKAYKKSKTIVKEKTPGRNDPCPCGSGKKYKKCCGA